MQRPALGVVISLALLLGGLPLWAGQAQPGTPPATEDTSSDPVATPADPDSEEAPPGEEAKPASLSLIREGKDGKEREILVRRSTVGAEQGVFVVCSPQEDEPENAPSMAVFSESGQQGVQISIDKNVIRVPLAVVTQRTREDGEASDGRVEASAGTAAFLEDIPEGAKDRLTRCGVQVTPKPAPDTVLVTQGKTELKGQKLVYDESDGIARVEGPITFKRENEKDPLTGTSDRIEVNVDDEKTVLVGNVVLNSAGGRVSKAARVEYDDTANVARLYGTPEQPAESRKGRDLVCAGYIRYDLDRNEVYTEQPRDTVFVESETDTNSSLTPGSTSGCPKRN